MALKASEAIGEVVRISNTRGIDSAGNKIHTKKTVKHIGAGLGAGAGKPRKYDTAQDYIKAFTDFCNEIRNNGFIDPNSGFPWVPNKSSFARWAGIDPRTVYNCARVYFPESKSDWAELLADTLTEGATAGVYDKTITIFCLKNWCAWADKNENVNAEIRPQLADKETAERLIREYTDGKKHE